jgi:hypothetical protein
MGALSTSKTTENHASEQNSEQAVPVNPWKMFAGIWRDNPDFDAFQKEIESLRLESDATQPEQ